MKNPSIESLIVDRMAGNSFSDPMELLRLRHCLTDWFATVLAGAAAAPFRIATQALLMSLGSGSSTVVGTAGSTNPREAAWLNALAAHSLDLDSSTLSAGAHLVTPVVAASLAVAEVNDCSGLALLHAIGQGLDVGHIVGLRTFSPDVDSPLHFTGYTGALASAAAAGSIIGLDESGLLKSIGLAATQSAGLKAMFGTMGKHMNAANPAASGVLAAQLVDSGFSAPSNGISADNGFAAAFAARPWQSVDAIDTGSVVSGAAATVFKYHACCHASHSIIEAIHDIRDKTLISPAEVTLIRLYVPGGVARLCAVLEPGNGVESQFCLPYIAAITLAGASTVIESFSDECVRSDEYGTLRKLVQIKIDSGSADPREPSRVEVTLRDGRQFAAIGPRLQSVSDAALDWQEHLLNDKLMRVASPILGPEQASRLLALLAGVADLQSIRPLAEILQFGNA